MKALELRQRVLDGLCHRSTVPVLNLADFSALCLASDDCLDSVVAAVVAVLWARDPSLFRLPSAEAPQDLEPSPLLEGWLYAPVHLHHPAAPG